MDWKKIPYDDKKEANKIEFFIRNTTNSTIYANFMGGIFNLGDNANNLRSFTYNLAGENFISNTITIQYKTNVQPTFITATLALQEQSINGLVLALNTLGIGTWFYSGTNLITYNDNYEFGSLSVIPMVANIATESLIDIITQNDEELITE